MSLQVTEIDHGRVVVVEQPAGHRFTFKLATIRGTQALDSMVPEWMGGQEPAGAHGLGVQARAVAERAAADQGWIETADPDVG